MKITAKIILVIALVISAVLMPACRQGVSFQKTDTVEGATNFVSLEMADGGVIIIELYPDIAPVTVANFQKLVASGFYDGLTFHRVIKDFMIQCGDPTGTGLGGSDETIVGEFAANGFQNDLKHERGVVSMGRKSNGYDTASSHFFICHGDASNLDGSYAAFGRVTEGMDVVDAIAGAATDENDKPLTDQTVSKASFIVK